MLITAKTTQYPQSKNRPDIADPQQKDHTFVKASGNVQK